MQQCHHDRKQLTVRTLSNNTVQYVYQCLDCGEAPGSAIKKVAALALNPDPPSFDHAFREQRTAELNLEFEKKRDARRKEKAEQFKLDRQHYNDVYLHSAEWRGLRDKVLRRCKGVCEGCGVAPATEVHHLTYEHIRREFLWELVGTCDSCHWRAHNTEANR